MFILDLPVPENCFDCYLLCDEMGRCLLFDGVPAHAHAEKEKRPDWCPIILMACTGFHAAEPVKAVSAI